MQRRHDRNSSKSGDQFTEQEKRNRINHSKRSAGKFLELCSKLRNPLRLVFSHRTLLCWRSQLHGHCFYLCARLHLTWAVVASYNKWGNCSWLLIMGLKTWRLKLSSVPYVSFPLLLSWICLPLSQQIFLALLLNCWGSLCSCHSTADGSKNVQFLLLMIY